MDLKVRRLMLVCDEIREIAGQEAAPPLRKIAAIAIVRNPFVDRYEADLSPLVAASVPLGRSMAAALKSALGTDTVESYGKAGLVGVRGEQEHASALLTTAFAEPIRQMIGQAPAWISSVTKVAATGCVVDVPVNNVHDIYVRSHYDAMSICIPDAPLPDEIAVIFVVMTRGRVSARVGGMTHEEAQGGASQPASEAS